MHKARTFFYVAAGIFLLALSYHLGARSAGAQGATIEATNVETNGTYTYYTCAVGRAFHYTPSPPATYTVPVDVPGTAAVVHTSTDGIYLTAVLADGVIYQWDGNAWVLRGNLLGAPTPTHQETWGAVKARYR